jgi:SNF2 family DNA or RNA helicase
MQDDFPKHVAPVNLPALQTGSDGSRSWCPPPRPTVTSLEFRLGPVPSLTEALVNRWNRQLTRPATVDVHTLWLSRRPPKVISVAIRQPVVRVRSFAFPEPAEAAASPESPLAERPPCGGQQTMPRPTGSTRIKPPGDVIKLQDRLHYILQPSLESLLAERSLAFPHQPFPFQLEGIAFLYPRQAAILADEMGLGKTMQAITAIRLLLRRGEVRTVLVVCPKTLVTNWQREFGLWAPEVPLLVIEGDQPKRLWQWQLPDLPVRIANYELLCRDCRLLEDGLGEDHPRVHFDLVVLDEAQRIKNRAGTTSQVARAVSRKRSWALTGTPVENSTEDLVGIFEFLAPGFLSPTLKPRRMGRAVSDYVLRRTKDQVLRDLPPKLFRDTELVLSPQQRESYRLAEERGVLRLTEMGASVTIQHVFELVLRLKQICNFDPASGTSSKLEQLQADLEEIAGSGRKAIVFSQWVATLRQLARRLRRFGPLEYHGRIPSGRRDAVIRRFRRDRRSHVMLMTYGAGGVGLNLQFANYLFLFDRWWNPAVEDQATGRAHRIGAASPVTVTRFLVRDTIEERIDHILRQKRDLFNVVFSEDRAPRNLGLTQRELFGLFRLECPGGPLDPAA